MTPLAIPLAVNPPAAYSGFASSGEEGRSAGDLDDDSGPAIDPAVMAMPDDVIFASR